MNKNKKVRCSHSSLGGGFCSPAACVVWRCPPPSGAPGAPSQKQREVPLPRFSDIVWCHDLSYTAPLRKTVNITKLLLRNPGFPTGRSPASVDRPVDTDANGEGRWRGFEICVASGPEAWPPRDQAPGPPPLSHRVLPSTFWTRGPRCAVAGSGRTWQHTVVRATLECHFQRNLALRFAVRTAEQGCEIPQGQRPGNP